MNNFILICIILALCLGASQAYFLGHQFSRIARIKPLNSVDDQAQSQDPRYQALVDRLKQDPSFNACLNPEDRAIFMANIPDNLRSIDNSIKRLAGTALHPTKGVSSMPELDDTLKNIDDPIKRTLSAPKSNFMRSPQFEDVPNIDELRKELIDHLKSNGQQIPAVFQD